MKDYVKCLECGYESARMDSFLDIPLTVRYDCVCVSVRVFVCVCMCVCLSVYFSLFLSV